MLQPKLGCHRHGHITISHLRCRKQDFFFHLDVGKQAGAELMVIVHLDVVHVFGGLIKKCFYAAMIICKKPVQWLVHSWRNPWPANVGAAFSLPCQPQAGPFLKCFPNAGPVQAFFPARCTGLSNFAPPVPGLPVADF